MANIFCTTQIIVMLDAFGKTDLDKQAILLLQNMASDGFLKASTNHTDNYNRVWARDAAVGILAILSANQTNLYPAACKSLLLLQQAANSYGQIPSNIALDPSGQPSSVSYGGTVGRTDAGFWWMIATVLYLQKQPTEALEKVALPQAEQLFKLADIWEFNGKHLMYVPMSSNWADEYITNGYVLYDQLLRYWALELAANYWNNPHWKEKAGQVKLAIKQHFLLEAEFEGSLFTQFQQLQLANWDISQQFIASFSPGQIVYRYDGWSIALLLLLDIPSAATKQKLISLLQQMVVAPNAVGIPAFWPSIEASETDYATLVFNHHYRFKNKPGHFHNGGIWPVINGFMVAALVIQNEVLLASQLHSITQHLLQNSFAQHPFAEYFDAATGSPQGVSELCYSASGWILGHQALQHPITIDGLLKPYNLSKAAIYQKVLVLAAQVLTHISYQSNKVICIAIAGESGCGKTTLANALKNLLEQQQQKVLLLHQDNYFKLPPHQNHQARLANFEHIGTHEVDFYQLEQHIQAVKHRTNNTLNIPVMNWQTDTCEVTATDIRQTQIIIVEGTYTMLLKDANHKIFITTNYKQTRNNRIERNRETVTDFIEQVLEKESAIIQSHAPLAHIWINEHMHLHTALPIESCN